MADISQKQSIKETVEEDKENEYSKNTALIILARSSCAEEAERACQELVLLNRGLVRSIVLRFRDRGIDFEDLMQIGTIGLLKAIKSFDTERGTKFSTYAVPMIFGEIRRTLRDEGPIKVGRYYKKLGIELVRARNDILEKEGADPSVGRLAKIVGVSPSEAVFALEAMAPIASFSELVYGEDDGTVLEDTIADIDSLSANERFFTSMALKEAIAQMPSDWQKILLLRYFRNMTQQQVADELGLSQVKISREEKKIVAFLREKML